MVNDNAKEPERSLPLVDGATASSLTATRLITGTDQVEQVPAPYPWGWQPRDDVQIASSWRRQILMVRCGGVQVRVQACLDEGAFGGVAGDQRVGSPDSRPDGVSEVSWPMAGDLIVVGSVPGAMPSLPGGVTTHMVALRDALDVLDIDTMPATLVDRGHAWTEPALVAVDLRSTAADAVTWQLWVLGLARQHGFDHVVRIHDGRWQVLRLTGPQAGVESVDVCSITRDVDCRCPMLRAPAEGEYCRMVGGPYGSRAIHAAASWKRHHDDLVAVLGCDTCEGTRYRLGDRIVTGGGPIAIIEPPAPSRWLAADDTRLLDADAGDE